MESLTVEEQTDLQLLEEGIARTIDSTITCAQLLLEIKERELYKGDFLDFKSYVATRWPEIGRSHLYRLLSAGEVAKNVPEVENERQARELAHHEKELQVEVFQIAKATAPVIDGKPSITAGHLKAVGDVLTAIIKEGAMADENGDMQPLGHFVKANVSEAVFERMKRQEDIIREKRETKTKDAVAKGDGKAVPTLPAAQVLMSIVRDLVKGIERMNVDRQTKMHPVLANPYYFGKAFIGEPLGELSVLVDNLSMFSTCHSCSDEDVPVKDVVLTITNNSIKSLRVKLCDHCVLKYQRIIDVVPEQGVAA